MTTHSNIASSLLLPVLKRRIRALVVAFAHMLAFLEGPELIIVLVIVLLVFGGSQLPKLARSLGQAQKEFKSGLAEGGKDEDTTTKGDSTNK